jgi:hypothetical protein
MIHSFTVTFGAEYLTGMVTCVPPYETFNLIKKIFFVILKSTKIPSKIQISEVCHVRNEQSECLLLPQLFIPTLPV